MASVRKGNVQNRQDKKQSGTNSMMNYKGLDIDATDLRRLDNVGAIKKKGSRVTKESKV